MKKSVILHKLTEIEEEILENEKLYEEKSINEKEYIRKQLKLLDELNVHQHKLENSGSAICKKIILWFEKRFKKRKKHT